MLFSWVGSLGGRWGRLLSLSFGGDRIIHLIVPHLDRMKKGVPDRIPLMIDVPFVIFVMWVVTCSVVAV